MAYGCTITVDTGKIPSAQTNFAWLATEANFPLGAKDGGVNSIDNGGGNLRCYTDSTKTTQIPIDVVTFITGVTPSIQVWGLSPTLNVSGTVYIEADSVATAQPAVTDIYGRNSVWVNYVRVYHLEEDPSGTAPQIIDSTGNEDLTSTGTMTTGDSVTAKIENGLDFDGTDDSIDGTTAPVSGTSDITTQFWASTTKSSLSRAAGWGTDSSGAKWGIRTDSGKLRLEHGGGFIAGSTNIDTGALIKSDIVKAGNTLADCSLYVNGSLETIATSSGTAVSMNIGTTNPLKIGRGVVAEFWLGVIDEFRVLSSAISADRSASEYNNQNDASTFWTTSAWVDSGGGISITANELSNIQTLDQVLLTQHNLLTVNNTFQSQSIDQFALSQNNILSLNDSSQAQTLEQVVLTQANILILNNLDVAQTLDQLSLTQNNILSINELSQIQSLDQITLTENNSLLVNGLFQTQNIDQINLGVAGIVSIDSFLQSQSLSVVTLAEVGSNLISVANLISSQALSGTQLTQHSLLSVDSLSQSQIIDAVNFGGIVIGYLQGELSIIYAYNGKTNIKNALTGETEIIENLSGESNIL